MVDAGAIAHLAQLVGSNDAKLKRQLFSALSQVAKHTVELAEMVVEAEIFPSVLTSLKGTCIYLHCSTYTRHAYAHNMSNACVCPYCMCLPVCTEHAYVHAEVCLL